MSERPVVGRIVELAAKSPALAAAGAEITREIVDQQRRQIAALKGVIAHIKNVIRQTTRSAQQKVERIGEVIAEYERENK